MGEIGGVTGMGMMKVLKKLITALDGMLEAIGAVPVVIARSLKPLQKATTTRTARKTALATTQGEPIQAGMRMIKPLVTAAIMSGTIPAV